MLCLGCNHRLDDLAAEACPGCDRPYQAFDRRTVNASGRKIGWLARSLLRASPGTALFAALVVVLAYLWDFRTPYPAMTILPRYWARVDLALLVPVCRILQLVVCVICAAFYGISPGALRSRRWAWPWLLLLYAGACLAIDARLPPYAGFWVSRPFLDRMADDALADPANAGRMTGRWAGVYAVQGVKVYGRSVVFYTGKYGGSYGFARVPGAAADRIDNDPRGRVARDCHYTADFPTTNAPDDPMGERLTGDWFVMFSWYMSVKDGWS
jgi:hypothetical protein